LLLWYSNDNVLIFWGLEVKSLYRYILGVALTAGLGCTSAYAENVSFEVVDGPNTVTFALPDSPTGVTLLGTTPDGFEVKNVSVILDSNGNISSHTDNLLFTDTGFLGDTDSFYSDTVAGSLYTGSNSAPSFVPGTYSAGSGETVTITDDVVPVPLPSTLPLMIAGLVGFGFYARSHRANV
jgi:hypothetical protein